MNILFVGSAGALSLVPLRMLIESRYTVCAVALEAAHPPDLHFPVCIEQQPTVGTVARQADIPVIYLSLPLTGAIDTIRGYAPDMILVSCFARKIPAEILAIPPLGCVNLHPSLLPKYRGPTPLFWQFRAGENAFGMTLHRMTAVIDAGPILLQTARVLPDGVSHQQAMRQLAETACDLLMLFLANPNAVVDHPQNAQLSTTMGFPDAADFSVSSAWAARRIYNFICATRHWGKVYPCQFEGIRYALLDALSFHPETTHALVIRGNQMILPCGGGTLTATLANT